MVITGDGGTPRPHVMETEMPKLSLEPLCLAGFFVKTKALT